MRKMLFLLGLFTLMATVSFAQERTKRKVQPRTGTGWRDDSLLWVKKPVGDASIKSPRDAASGQATGKRKKPARRPQGGN